MGRPHRVVRRHVPVPIARNGPLSPPARPRGLSRIVKNFMALHSLEAFSCHRDTSLEKGWYDVMRDIGPALEKDSRVYVSVCRISRYDSPMDTVADITFALEADGLL